MKKMAKILSVFAVMAMLITGIQFPQVDAESADTSTGAKRLDNAVVLYIGSPNASVNNKDIQIDESNPEVRPFVKNGRTLVPVRFIAESLGANVTWDAATSTITITLGEKSVKMVLGNTKMKVGNSEVTLEVPAESVNGRTFVPLRQLSEALGKKLFYDKGLIVMSDKEKIFDSVSEKSLIDETIARINTLPVVGTLENLKKLLEKANSTRASVYSAMGLQTGSMMKTLQADAAPATVESKAGSDYSTTNVQVQGVDESDSVKTDGEYIYQVNDDRLVVAKAYPSSQMAIKSIIKYLPNQFTPQELYLNGQQLIVIGTAFREGQVKKEQPKQKSPMEGKKMPPLYDNPGTNTVKAIIYDISDKENLKQLREVEIEGYLVSSRRIGSSLYIVSNKNVQFFHIMNEGENEGVAPAYRDTVLKDDFVDIAYDNIRYFPICPEPNYMIVAGINLDRMDEVVNISTYLGSGQNIYASLQNLYVAVTNYKFEEAKPQPVPGEKPVPLPETTILPMYDRSSTLVYKFSLNDGKATYLSQGNVEGKILNQFSMDENGKYFRIATNSGEMWRGGENPSRNNLYIFDETMNTIGKLEGIAPGERIYSTRFIGDRGYMVTFKTVDPLFVIDLKDPYNPKILGALKIPGYSEYLHPYDENHIIGLGKDTIEVSSEDEKGNVISTRGFYMGMKMAIFDITDVTNPIQMFTEVIGDRGTNSELLRNHKALLFNKDKNLLAFPITVMQIKNKQQPVNQGTGFPEYGEFAYQGAYVYNIDLVNGFKLKGKITHLSADDYARAGNSWYDSSKNIDRIMYIDDNLYTISRSEIRASGMADLGERGSLVIPQQ